MVSGQWIWSISCWQLFINTCTFCDGGSSSLSFYSAWWNYSILLLRILTFILTDCYFQLQIFFKCRDVTITLPIVYSHIHQNFLICQWSSPGTRELSHFPELHHHQVWFGWCSLCWISGFCLFCGGICEFTSMHVFWIQSLMEVPYDGEWNITT